MFFHFNFFRSPVPIPFQYAASVWGQKNLIVKRNQKNSSPVQIVAVVVSWYFVYVCTMTPHYSYMRFLSIEKSLLFKAIFDNRVSFKFKKQMQVGGEV